MEQKIKRKGKVKKVVLGTTLACFTLSAGAYAGIAGVNNYVDSILNNVYNKLEEFVSGSNKEISDLNERLTSITEERDSLVTQLDTANSLITTHEQTITELNAHIERLENEGATDSETISNLRTELENATKLYEDTKAERDSLATQLEEANSQILALNNSISELEASNQDQASQINELIAMVNAQNESASSFEEKVNTLISAEGTTDTNDSISSKVTSSYTSSTLPSNSTYLESGSVTKIETNKGAFYIEYEGDTVNVYDSSESVVATDTITSSNRVYIYKYYSDITLYANSSSTPLYVLQ